jgi:hypothetical protein
MSTQPDENEIEEGEIVTDDETEEEIEETEEEVDDDLMFEDDGVDLPTLMTSLLATEDGDTVCSALVGISQQLQMQNKILIKILSELKN